MYIDDGTGSGRKAAVTIDHLLQTVAYTFPYEHFNNHVYRGAYNCVFMATPEEAATFLYLKNTDDIDLTVTDFKIYCDSTEVIEIVMGEVGTPSGGYR